MVLAFTSKSNHVQVYTLGSLLRRGLLSGLRCVSESLLTLRQKSVFDVKCGQSGSPCALRCFKHGFSRPLEATVAGGRAHAGGHCSKCGFYLRFSVCLMHPVYTLWLC